MMKLQSYRGARSPGRQRVRRLSPPEGPVPRDGRPSHQESPRREARPDGSPGHARSTREREAKHGAGGCASEGVRQPSAARSTEPKPAPAVAFLASNSTRFRGRFPGRGCLTRPRHRPELRANVGRELAPGISSRHPHGSGAVPGYGQGFRGCFGGLFCFCYAKHLTSPRRCV